jgi:hypothetical protein
MKRRTLVPVLALVLACLALPSCVTGGNGNGDDNNEPKPNFVKDTCSGCPAENALANGFRFISYVKNIGGAGKIGMSIASSKGSASKEFTVTANTSYTFSADVPAQAKASAEFTYSAKFPGDAGYTDTRTKKGYDCTGAPANLQMNPR